MTNNEYKRRRRLIRTVLAYAVILAAAGGLIQPSQSKAAPFTFDAVFSSGPFGIWIYNSTNAWTHAPNWVGGAVPPNDGTATVSIERAWHDLLQPSVPGVFVDAPWTIKELRFGGPRPDNNGPHVISGAALTIGDGGITNTRDDAATIYNALILSSAYQSVSALRGDLDIRGNVNLQNNTLSLREYNGNNVNIAGIISGAGTLNIGGNISSGTDVNFSQIHTYTGDTIIDFGSVLRLSGAGKLSSATDVVNNGAFVMNSGNRSFNSLSGAGTTSMAGGSITLNSLSGTGQISLASGVLSVGSGSFSGLIGGAGGLTKTGAATLTLNTAQSYAGQTTVSAGTLWLTGAGSVANSSRVVVEAGGTLDFAGAGTSNVKDLSIGAGAAVQITSGGTKNLITSALSIAGGDTPTGTLDLTGNAAVIAYTGTSPAATVRQQIISGRGGAGLGAMWNGLGITSSAAAAENIIEADSRSVGYAENAALPLGAYTTFHGAGVDDSSILIAFTRTGDAHLDGVVNDDDVTIVGATYAPGIPNASWALGDFDYNGFVDDDDVTLLGAFYDPSAAPFVNSAPAANMAAVPEPSTHFLASVMAGGLLFSALFAARRGRSRSSPGV